jgi:hypothetical protein
VFLEGTAPAEQCESSWAPSRWLSRLEQLDDVDLSSVRALLDEATVSDARALIRDLARELRREARRLTRER